MMLITSGWAAMAAGESVEAVAPEGTAALESVALVMVWRRQARGRLEAYHWHLFMMMTLVVE
jgi:ketosteroid isomerase-like protein